MPITAELAAVLGRKLLLKYLNGDGVPRPADDLIPKSDEIAKSLMQFVEEFGLDLGGITEPGEVTDSVLTLITKGVKKIQQDTRRLKADGVIGARTARWTFGKRFGHHNRSIQSLPESASKVIPGKASRGDKVPTIRYYLEDELPAVPNALKLFREAWDSWSEFLVMKTIQTDVGDKGNANVIVKQGRFPGSVVGKGDIGPPDNRQLNLTFDITESWTALEFQATAAHEIGHLLGIRHAHVAASNQLMNDFLDPGIITPQKFDIQAAVAVGWKLR